MSPLVSGECAVLAFIALVLGFLALTLLTLVVSGWQRWRAGAVLYRECHGDRAMVWAELRRIVEANIEDERRLREGMRHAQFVRDFDRTQGYVHGDHK